jgi:hypothetical protein
MTTVKDQIEGSAPGPAAARERVPVIDFLTINVPAILFLVGAGLCAILLAIWKPGFPLFLVAAIPLWWSLCAATMLAVDYARRKRGIYLKLRRTGPPERGSPLANSLRQTVCGAMVYAAALRSTRTSRT